MNNKQLQKAISKLRVGQEYIGSGTSQHWDKVCHRLLNNELIPNTVIGEGSLRDLGRLTVGLLAVNMEWLPYTWPRPSNHSEQYQSVHLLLKDFEPPFNWWNSFLAEVVVIMQQALYEEVDKIPDLFIRDAYECYNELSAELLLQKDVSVEQKQKIIDWYFVDPRFPNVILGPLLKREVPDEVLITINLRQYSAALKRTKNPLILWPKNSWAYQTWINNFNLSNIVPDMLSRHGSAIRDWLGSDYFNETSRPTHSDFAKAIFFSRAFLQHTSLTVLHIRKIQKRYSDADMDDAVHSVVRYVVLDSNQDWCAGIFLYWGNAMGVASTIQGVMDRFRDDQELVQALRLYLNQAIKVAKSKKKLFKAVA